MKNTLRPQAVKVLSYFQKLGSGSEHDISLWTGQPAPSVRRSIQELTRAGHNVTFAGHNGVYTLGSS